MSSSAATMSLTDQARRLAALARARRESETDLQDQLRLQGQVSKLADEIGALKTILKTHRELAAIGVPVAELPDLAVAPSELRGYIDRIGRPNWQYLSARVTSLSKTHAKAAEADAQSWTSWAIGEIARLPRELVPRLGAERSATESRLTTLERLASRPPTLSSPAEFRMLLGRVADDLENVESAGVDAVLSRFIQGRIRLSDLSDDEFELLRLDETVRDQLYLSLS